MNMNETAVTALVLKRLEETLLLKEELLLVKENILKKHEESLGLNDVGRLEPVVNYDDSEPNIAMLSDFNGLIARSNKSLDDLHGLGKV